MNGQPGCFISFIVAWVALAMAIAVSALLELNLIVAVPISLVLSLAVSWSINRRTRPVLKWHLLARQLDRLLTPYRGGAESAGPWEFSIRLPNWAGRLRIRGNDVHVELEAQDLRFGKLFVPPEVKPAEPVLEPSPSLFVQTDYAEGQARRFLDEPVLKAFRSLNVVSLQPGFLFRLEGSRLRLSKSLGRRHPTTVAIVARIAFRLASRAAQTLALAEGIEIVEEGAGPALCPVCGCPLDAGVVACQGCATPHHAECWEYEGVCATYGCGQRRFTKS